MKKLSTQKLIVIVVLVIGVVIAGLMLSGRLVVSFKNPETTFVAKSKICDSNLIAQYNSIFSAEAQGQYKEQLGKVANMVDELEGADSDPNCVYIQFMNYLEAEDIDNAQERLNVLKTLAEEDAYLTGELANPQGLDNAEQSLVILKAVKNPDSTAGEQEPVRGEG